MSGLALQRACPRAAWRASALLLTVLLAAGCGSDGGLDCNAAAALTYNNFGKGFLLENCQSCHSSTAPNRQAAPAAVTFDDLADVEAHVDRILLRATGTAPTMPPGGGVPAEDRERFEAWLVCNGPV